MGSLFSSSSSSKEEENNLLINKDRSNGSSINKRNIGNKRSNTISRKNNEKKTGFFNFLTRKKNNGRKESNGSIGSNGRKEELDIFEKIQNIYFQRHAVSCANTIEKVFGKGQLEKSKHAANSGISYVGVQQCLQVCDYFDNFRINAEKTSGKKPLIIFCCSELIRTQQTLFLSWLKYLKDYKKENGKIIVLPWLNEVSLPSKFGIVVNKDNYPASLLDTKEAWSKFIQNINNNIQKIKDDTLNQESSLQQDINGFESWDQLFYLSPLIFKEGGDPLSNSGKKTPIKRIWEHAGKRVGDMSQFIGLFNKILATYINDINKDKEKKINLNDYDGIELVLVAHHNSAEHLMKFLLPSTQTQFEEQQLVNCEVVKLPGACLKNPGKNNGIMERIYPTKFNKELNIQINREILEENEKTLSRRERRIFVNPLFILYMSELNLFLSVNNIVKTRLKARFVDKGMKQMGNYVSKKRIQVKKPLFKFLFNLTAEDYYEELINAKVYIQQLQKEYEGKQTFYKYADMIAKIQEKIGFLDSYFKKKGFKTSNIMNQKSQKIQSYIKNNKKNINITMPEEKITEKLKEYLFGFCGLEQPDIDSIAVF
jgi:cation transport regulator ChaC